MLHSSVCRSNADEILSNPRIYLQRQCRLPAVSAALSASSQLVFFLGLLQEKSITEFTSKTTTSDGLKKLCKQCASQTSRQWRAELLDGEPLLQTARKRCSVCWEVSGTIRACTRNALWAKGTAVL